MKQYLELCKRIISTGQWVYNERTNTKCLTCIDANFEYNGQSNKLPIVTTRKSFWKPAVAELLGYIRGYNNAADFRRLGTKSWDANANKTSAWISNPVRKGTDDMGRVYGVQGREWKTPSGNIIDQLQKVVNNLTNGIDDRGEIITFYNPGEFDLGCLRPCMHTHNFSLINNQLYLTSYQRSVDVPLGLVFNQIQVYVFLRLIAQITNTYPNTAFHKMVNVHIYENQLSQMEKQIKREPYNLPIMNINPNIKTLKDLETWVSLHDFEVVGYQHHAPIPYPFST